jgi:GntR family transcriptional regulator
MMTLPSTPSRDSSITIPLYIKIADHLIAQIEAGDLLTGDQLPPERKLSSILGINRMTLRRSLKVLQSQGLIIRVHGVGTFIAEPKIDRQVDTVFRFTTGMLNRGFSPQAELISINQSEAETKVARDLALTTSSRVFNIVRLRSINHEPVMIETYQIPLSRFPGLDQFDLENRSIYEVMESEYGIKIVRAKQSFEPVLATEFESGLLNISEGDPLMLERRISYDPDNLPVEAGRDRYRGDRFRFVTETAPADILPHLSMSRGEISGEVFEPYPN